MKSGQWTCVDGGETKRREMKYRLRQIWTEGYENRRSGKPKTTNPYVKEDDKTAWLGGWRTADLTKDESLST